MLHEALATTGLGRGPLRAHAIVGYIQMDSSEPQSTVPLIQLIAAAVAVIGIILTAIAAVQAANPTIQVAITLVGAAVLAGAVYRNKNS